ncbi:unnamed protein product [Rotaria socialis]|uniref:IRG-type G domain-containing protein n=1 Tax=Rotaria socialis TaxID=392032 RepID=A0A821RCW4_9BILA|nr:unnamed protein product [Rotaria socialis]
MIICIIESGHSRQGTGHLCHRNGQSCQGHGSSSNYEKKIETKFKAVESDDMTNFREEVKKWMESGLHNYESFLSDQATRWERCPLSIAVTGSAGQGKSSLINTLRGLKPGSDGAAKVCEVECTQEIAEYPDPTHPNLIYYDLPGVGTPKFSRSEYFNMIKNQTKHNMEFKDFDFFLILSADRFTEEDAWLAQQINGGGKQFYFVRTKIDISINNSRDNDPDNFNEEKLLNTIQTYCLKELNALNRNIRGSINNGWNEANIFLLSTKLFHSDRWDFRRMRKSLMKDYPDKKRDSFIMSFRTNSKDILREKVSVLQKGLWQYAMVSALGGAVPYPVVSTVIDLATVQFALSNYKKHLGLDHKSLEILLETYQMGSITSRLKSSASYLFYTPDQVFAKIVRSEINDEIAEKTTKQLLKYFPMLGQLVDATISYRNTYIQLYEMLNELESAGINVIDYARDDFLKSRDRSEEL